MVLNPFLPVQQEVHGVRSIKVKHTGPDIVVAQHLQNFMTNLSQVYSILFLEGHNPESLVPTLI